MLLCLFYFICCPIPIINQIARLGGVHKRYSSGIAVVRLQTPRGSNIPFYLMTWAQIQILQHNCEVCKASATESVRSAPGCKYCRNEDEFMFHRHRSAIDSRVVTSPPRSFAPINYVYYTEADQILSFSDINTMLAISDISNSTTVLFGRRRYKSNTGRYPDRYDVILNKGRGCGAEGYAIDWPASKYILCNDCTTSS